MRGLPVLVMVVESDIEIFASCKEARSRNYIIGSLTFTFLILLAWPRRLVAINKSLLHRFEHFAQQQLSFFKNVFSEFIPVAAVTAADCLTNAKYSFLIF
jgi:hypothetical protein